MVRRTWADLTSKQQAVVLDPASIQASQVTVTTTAPTVRGLSGGPQTDWYRNLRSHPATTVQLRGATVTPQQRFLSEEEAFDVAVQFRREHPHRLWFFSTLLGWGDLRDDAAVRAFVRSRPFVAFRPAEESTTRAYRRCAGQMN